MKIIAIIEDDQHIGDILERTLTREGYGTLRAYSGTEALYLLSEHTPDLILLDLMLPGLPGEEILPRMQGIPVIVVSAKVGIDDKVDMLLGGAADYITKPFDMKELLARITVQLRRSSGREPSSILSCGDLRLDMVSHELAVKDIPVKLTKTEYAILKLLMQNPKQAISKLKACKAEPVVEKYRHYQENDEGRRHRPKILNDQQNQQGEKEDQRHSIGFLQFLCPLLLLHLHPSLLFHVKQRVFKSRSF